MVVQGYINFSQCIYLGFIEKFHSLKTTWLSSTTEPGWRLTLRLPLRVSYKNLRQNLEEQIFNPGKSIVLVIKAYLGLFYISILNLLTPSSANRRSRYRYLCNGSLIS